jgi:hypothetical protein
VTFVLRTSICLRLALLILEVNSLFVDFKGKLSALRESCMFREGSCLFMGKSGLFWWMWTGLMSGMELIMTFFLLILFWAHKCRPWLADLSAAFV